MADVITWMSQLRSRLSDHGMSGGMVVPGSQEINYLLITIWGHAETEVPGTSRYCCDRGGCPQN